MFSSMRSSFQMPDRLDRRRLHQLVGVHEGEVTDEDRHTLAESAGLPGPARPRRVRRGDRAWVVGCPRRVAASSITSSWNSANACISSNAAPASMSIWSSAPPPAPTYPQWQNAGRSRLPPDEHQAGDLVDRVREVRGRGGPALALDVEQIGEPGVDPVGETPKGRRWRPWHGPAETNGLRASARSAAGGRFRRPVEHVVRFGADIDGSNLPGP